MRVGLRSLRNICVLFIGLSVGAASAFPDSEPQSRETLTSLLDHDYPRLVVVMSFDQFRADYLTRFSDLFVPAAGAGGSVGGFRYLLEHGAFHVDAHYNHVPMHTGPGHATIMTGAAPNGSGIVGNEWLTTDCRSLNCVEDNSLRTIGGPQRPMQRGGSGPTNLLADTVCDSLRMSNNFQSKVVGIAIKDRGAILMAGHNPNGVVWYDSGIGRWVTSSYYTTGTLPKFAARANQERISERWFGKEWDYLLPKENYARSHPEGFKGAGNARGMDATFPKKLSDSSTKPDTNYFERLPYTPFANEMIFETAKMAVVDEELGADAIPDILCLSFSPNDYIGHVYGPNSAEVQDMTLRTDRYMADFLNFLRLEISGGLDSVVVVVTADHGAAPLAEYAGQGMKLDAGRYDGSLLTNAAEEALATRFPDKDTSNIVQMGEPFIYFRQSLLQERAIDAAEARKAIALRLRGMPGIFAAYTRDEIQNHQLLPSQISESVYNGFHPERSGDVLLLSKPFWYPTRNNTGSTHGTGFNYDTHVPMVFAGSMIRPGLYTKRVDVRDIAPTLSVMLGISAPASSQGVVLGDMLK
ncbi:MAG: alkaline phosphatase family protein [Candidatus Sumerlaeaceae bacterium]